MVISNLHPSISVGVLGGTFDPPHNGHLKIAQEALTQLQLSQVLFAPTSQPPHKLDKEITPVVDRVEMVRRAIANNPQFALSRVDVDRVGPTYTVDTMRMLREQMPNAEFYFIMGMDSLANILSWYKPDELIRLCKLAVFERPGFSIDLKKLDYVLPNLSQRIAFIHSAPMAISATELQRRVRAGESILDCVPASVASYIAARGLYRA